MIAPHLSSWARSLQEGLKTIMISRLVLLLASFQIINYKWSLSPSFLLKEKYFILPKLKNKAQLKRYLQFLFLKPHCRPLRKSRLMDTQAHTLFSEKVQSKLFYLKLENFRHAMIEKMKCKYRRSRNKINLQLENNYSHSQNPPIYINN